MSNAWEIYDSRMLLRGTDERDVMLRNESARIALGAMKNLAFNSVDLADEKRAIAIIDTDNMNEKRICSLPGEDIPHGGLIFWNDNYWLVTERDVNNTIYTRAKMIQCNCLLRWVSDDCAVHEQWCIVEDGTKYLTGEFEDRNFIVTRGDSRIALTIAKNELTTAFHREMRFIIDDPDSPEKIAYLLTKPLKVGNVYNQSGVFKFVLQEVVTTDDDNLDLMIADYYKFFPRENTNNDMSSAENNDDNSSDISGGKKVWI